MTWDVRKDTTNIWHSVHKTDFHICLLTLEYIFLFPDDSPTTSPMSRFSDDADAWGSMLISWYMSGYHTGYYMVSDHQHLSLTVTLWFCDFVLLVTRKWFHVR